MEPPLPLQTRLPPRHPFSFWAVRRQEWSPSGLRSVPPAGSLVLSPTALTPPRPQALPSARKPAESHTLECKVQPRFARSPPPHPCLALVESELLSCTERLSPPHFCPRSHGHQGMRVSAGARGLSGFTEAALHRDRCVVGSGARHRVHTPVWPSPRRLTICSQRTSASLGLCHRLVGVLATWRLWVVRGRTRSCERCDRPGTAFPVLPEESPSPAGVLDRSGDGDTAPCQRSLSSVPRLGSRCWAGPAVSPAARGCPGTPDALSPSSTSRRRMVGGRHVCPCCFGPTPADGGAGLLCSGPL